MVKVSQAEYTLLKEGQSILKKQTALLRVLEAEENLRRGRVVRTSFVSFIKAI